MAREARLDNVDIAILRALQLDARTRYSDIAQTQGVSVDTIIKRFRKLKRSGVVKRTTLLLDPRRLGLEVVANLAVTAEPNSIEEVVDYIRGRGGVLFATHSMGQYDVFALAATRTMNEMNALKESIQGHGKVKDVKASIWVDQFLLCPQNFELEPLLEGRR
jgi:DNA-binding Lrp family transcriptional regulator